MEFPAYTDECISDPTWGHNQTMTYDCGHPKDGWVRKITSTPFKQDFECAYQTLEKINFTPRMIAEAAALVLADNNAEEEAADIWIRLFNEQWRQWRNIGCAS